MDELHPDDDNVTGRKGAKRKSDKEPEPVPEPHPEFMCTMPACKSYGKNFQSARNYNKHVKYTLHS